MKILHLADLHLGKSINSLPLIDDQAYVLKQAINLCKKENIKNIIISGDVYDRSIPNEDAVALLDKFLSKAVLEEKLHVYMIAGNHDSKERLSCFNNLLNKAGLFIDGKITSNLSMPKYVLEEDGLKVNLYCLPYIYPGEIREKSNDENVKDFESGVKKVLEVNAIDENEINILSTHYFVYDGTNSPKRSESETKISVGTLEQISYKVFDKFDYVALGHLHAPQAIGRETVRYAGSPLRYSVSEIEQNKTFTIIDIVSKNNISINEVPIKPLHEFVLLNGKIDELTKDSDKKDDRLVYFELEDETNVLNAAIRLKTKYPNYVGLRYKNNVLPVGSDISLAKSEGFAEKNYAEQFADFFKYVYGKEMNEMQKEIITQLNDELLED